MRSQRGLAALELALLSPFFFLVLFGITEVARMSFIWNTLDAVTQRAARAAIVCPPNHRMIKHVAQFGKSATDESAVLIKGFENVNIHLEYLDSNFNTTGGTFPVSFVRVSIVDFEHQLLIPFFGQTISAPPFTTTLPAESMGYNPSTGDRRCFGSKI